MAFTRITPEEALKYIELLPGDPDRCKKATAFTLTPVNEPGWEGWEEVRYYTDGSVPDYKVHPLEAMYRVWDSEDLERDRGDERDL